jgi:AraC-like DNA-binding protein
MEYKEYAPCHQLAKYIECYWFAYSDKPPFREKESLIPDGTIELIFNFGDSYAQISGDRKIEIKGSHVIGIRKESLIISQTTKQNLFCIRFKLGGIYPFFKIPVHLFANGFFQLQELFGNEFAELEERLYEAADNSQRIVLVEYYLLKKLHYKLDDYLFVGKCYQAIFSSNAIKVNDLVSRFNTNYKTLERKFFNVLGLSPSELIKIKRFNNAVLLMYACKYDSLTSIGYECGYFDQAHFIRDFKQLTGYSPKEFIKEQFTIVQVIQPALAERMSKSYNF